MPYILTIWDMLLCHTYLPYGIYEYIALCMIPCKVIMPYLLSIWDLWIHGIHAIVYMLLCHTYLPCEACYYAILTYHTYSPYGIGMLLYHTYLPYGIYEYTALCMIPCNVIYAILTYHMRFMDTWYT